LLSPAYAERRARPETVQIGLPGAVDRTAVSDVHEREPVQLPHDVADGFAADAELRSEPGF
jgi:hypothetical protein